MGYSIPYEMSIRGGPNDPYHNLNLPSADHIIVDLQNLDPYFLRNEKQLINAMKDVIQVSNIPLLSYQCHEHESLGFSCAAILIESYLTFFYVAARRFYDFRFLYMWKRIIIIN